MPAEQAPVPFIRSVFFRAALDYLPKGLSFLFSPIALWCLTSSLTVAEFGSYAYLNNFISFLFLGSSLGFLKSIHYILPKEDPGLASERTSQTLISVQVLHIAILSLAAFLIFGTPISLIFQIDTLPPTILILLLISFLFQSIYTIESKYLIILLRNYPPLIADIINATAGFVLLLIFFYLGRLSFHSALLIKNGAFLFAAIFLFVALRRTPFRWKPPKLGALVPHIGFSIPQTFIDANLVLLRFIDQYFVTVYLGKLVLGQYAFAYTYTNYIYLAVSSFIWITSSYMNRAYYAGDTTWVRYLRAQVQIASLFSMVAVCFLIGGQDLLLSLFQTEYRLPGPYLAAMSAAPQLMLLSMIFQQILTMQKRIYLVTIIYGSSVLLKVLLNVFFLPKFGLIAAVLNTLLCWLAPVVAFWYCAVRSGALSRAEFRSVLLPGLAPIFLSLGLAFVLVLDLPPCAKWISYAGVLLFAGVGTGIFRKDSALASIRYLAGHRA